MSKHWERWQAEMLEKEREFERPRIVRRNQPWTFWDLVFTLTATVLVIAGLMKIWEGFQ